MKPLYIDIQEAQRRQRKAQMYRWAAYARSWGRLINGKTRRRR